MIDQSKIVLNFPSFWANSESCGRYKIKKTLGRFAHPEVCSCYAPVIWLVNVPWMTGLVLATLGLRYLYSQLWNFDFYEILIERS